MTSTATASPAPDVPAYIAGLRTLLETGRPSAAQVTDLAERCGVQVGRGGRGIYEDWPPCPYCGAHGGGGCGGFCPTGMIALTRP